MNPPDFDLPASLRCAPYRAPDYAAARPTPPPPAIGPALTLALAAVTLSVSLATLGAVRAARPAPAVRPALAVAAPRPAPTLIEAAGELARRHRLALFVAPDVAERAARLPVVEGSDAGSMSPAVRALDGYAAARGLWIHVAAGVLRVERESATVDLACDDTVAVCADRVERLASIAVVYAQAAATRPIQLRARRGTPAAEAMRAALETAGLRVDAVGRTLFVATDAPPEAAVRRLGDGRFVLSRAAVEAMLDRPGELARATRILPFVRGGRTVGVQVLGVHAGDLLERLGLETGDVLTRVNGYDVVSPDRCLEAYAAVRRADRLRVELLRRGRPVTLSYVIEPG